MMSIPRRALIGVLGGMGPAATIDFMIKMLKATTAANDQEHVPMIVHDVPQIPDRSTAIQNNSDEPWLPLLAGALMLERAGAELIAIPCNTAHHWYERLARSTNVEIVHIADAVNWSIKTRFRRINRLALMATRGTIQTAIYGERLADVVDQLIIPDVSIQNLIDQSIGAVKSGARPLAAMLAGDAAGRLLDAGADALLLACTELPVALEGSHYLGRSIDATDALAHHCVRTSISRLLGRQEAPSTIV
jgi:aspartate racemase